MFKHFDLFPMVLFSANVYVYTTYVYTMFVKCHTIIIDRKIDKLKNLVQQCSYHIDN